MATPDRFPLPQVPDSTRKPAWLKVRMPHGDGYERVKAIVKKTGLATVCEEARCPNIAECWGGGTATVMLMGEVCTRACRFCHVKVGAPPPLDPQEPENLARAVKELNLEYIVVTSVNRDDRPDGGASHFAHAITALRRESPKTIVEVLIPDFKGVERDLTTIAVARPHVVAHNIETIERLTPTVRDRRADVMRVVECVDGTVEMRMEWVIRFDYGEIVPWVQRRFDADGRPAITAIGGPDAVYGRVGLLAHTFMLGPSGASNDCVSFRDYNRFLDSYLRGEIRQLVVVAGSGGAPPNLASSGAVQMARN